MRGFEHITLGSLAAFALATTTLGLATQAAPVRAQEAAQDEAPKPKLWSLPEPTQSPSIAPLEGPVDPKDPTTLPGGVKPLAPLSIPTTTASPRPSPSPAADTPAPTARPDKTPAPTHTAAPASAPKASSSTRAPSASPPPAAQRAEPTPTQTAPTQEHSTGRTAPSASVPVPSPNNAEPDKTPQTTNASMQSEAEWPVWWWALPVGLLALGALAFLLARRRGANDAADEAAPSSAPARQVPRSHPPAKPEQPVGPAATSAVPPARLHEPKGPEAHGEIAFEPLSLRLSLVYASLRYRFSLRALTQIPPSKLHGDLASAHGSAGRTEQLEPTISSLPVLGTIPRLKEGEDVVLEGELQLPLGAIRAVREGPAAFLVPLVRLALLADVEHPDYSEDLPHMELGFVFTVGQIGQAGPDGALTPFRIDTGPRDFAHVDAREIEAGRRKRLLPLDLTPAAV